MAKIIIEAAVNGGGLMRDINPHVPYGAAEVAADALACIEAGAALVHYHVRDPRTGRQVDTVDAYGEVVRRVRAHSDALLWPTVPPEAQPERRFAHFIGLADAGASKPDLMCIDMGTADFATYDPASRDYRTWARFTTSYEMTRFALELARERGYLPPSLQILDPGSVRTALVLVEQGHLAEPVLFNLHIGGPARPMNFGPTRKALEAYMELAAGIRCNWMVGVQGGDILESVPLIVSLGCHLRVGLEDWHHDGRLGNPEIVARAAALVRAAGHEVASVDDARRVLGLAQPISAARASATVAGSRP